MTIRTTWRSRLVSMNDLSLDSLEQWHRMSMEVAWTDSGKMIIRHMLANGSRINHVFDIGPDKASDMTKGKSNA